MCNYVDLSQGVCKISSDKCPYVFFCNKILSYKQLSSMPDNCQIKVKHELPKGYNKVAFERHGYLYIEVDEFTEVIKNPYTYVPSFVKLSKTKTGSYKIKEAIK